MREVVRTTNSSIQRSTISRLSGLLDGIRGQQKGKKRQIDKKHRIQIRWIYYDEKSQAFIPVRQKNAGGNSFVSYSSSEDPTFEELKKYSKYPVLPRRQKSFLWPSTCYATRCLRHGTDSHFRIHR